MEPIQSSGNNPSENRKHVRYRIDHDPILVFDLGTASSLGQLENITIGGCLLKSDQPTNLDQVFRISLSVPEELTEKTVIRCSARSLWSSPIENLWNQENQAAKQFWTGYEFLDLSPAGIQTIESLIKKLGRAT